MATTNTVNTSVGDDHNSSSADKRVNELLPQLTLAEKAGLLFQDILLPGPNGTLSSHNPVHGGISTEELIVNKSINHFNIIGPVTNVRDLVTWHNNVQQLALSKTRVRIPITISTDPRNHFTDNFGTGFSAGSFSQWPETLGLAALRDEKLVERFADVARQEYLACGIRLALHPQVDLATEPRWARVSKTFGEDVDLTARLARAYIRGFQGGANTEKSQSVSCVTKHFPGGGSQKDGEDSHFERGKDQVYPGGRFEDHLKPFAEVIDEGTRWIMPHYGRPVDLDGVESVGFAFNKGIITGLLREKMKFQGIVCSDWGLVTDAVILGQEMPARAWGFEHLSELERAQKILEAGCDQFGGESRPELIVELVQKGLIEEKRLDESVGKLLKEKFELGLFDHRFLDPDTAEKVVGRDDFKKEGELTQRRSFTLLTNQNNVLPLRNLDQKKIYVEGLDVSRLKARGSINVVESPEQSDLAILRLKCPHEPRPGGFEAMFPDGSLEFTSHERVRQSLIYRSVPTIVDVYLDRPAVMPEIAEQAAALMVNYGANVDAFLDVLTGEVAPEGLLPFDMPRSMEAVARSREDVPFDTQNPVFRFGHGLRYTTDE